MKPLSEEILRKLSCQAAGLARAEGDHVLAGGVARRDRLRGAAVPARELERLDHREGSGCLPPERRVAARAHGRQEARAREPQAVVRRLAERDLVAGLDREPVEERRRRAVDVDGERPLRDRRRPAPPSPSSRPRRSARPTRPRGTRGAGRRRSPSRSGAWRRSRPGAGGRDTTRRTPPPRPARRRAGRA